MDYIMNSFNLPRLPATLGGWGKSLRFRLMWADYMLSHQENALNERLDAMPTVLIRPTAVKRQRVKHKIKQVQDLRRRLDYYSLQLTGAPVHVTGD